MTPAEPPDLHDGNPYRPPDDVAPPRSSPWVGNAVLALAILVYGPMTAAPLAMAVFGDELLMMLMASAFNGAVLAGLIWLGLWLRRRALAPVAPRR